jgi:CPA2 family monovalent cation:H+ antiporter-2
LELKNILGAFLAGTLVSLLSPNQEMTRQLDSFGYGFLIPIFFVMVGVDLHLWSMFSDKKLLLFIPLLLIAFFASKIIPVFLLKKWYDTKTVVSSAFLMTSTLSLVIASSKIAERIGIITPQMSGTLILVAVITCIITPHTILDKADNQIADSLFDVKEIKNYEVDTLENEGIFTSDIMVIMTGNEEVNAELATTAKGRGVERVIARIKES